MIFAFRLLLALAFVSVAWMVKGERSLNSSASSDQKTERETERTRYRREESGPQMLTQAERIEFLATHNNIRSDITGAFSHPQPAAAGMMKMYWSAQLEASALSWSMRCPDKSKIHGQTEIVKTPEFLSSMSQYGMWIGQNIHRNIGGKATPIKIVRAFGSESTDFVFNEGARGTCNGPKCGHYTQVVWYSTFLVGCGTVLCDNKIYMTTCNYMPGGNYAGSAPYKSGPACSLCASDTTHNFTECEGQLCVPKDRCSPVKECQVVDTVNCLCSEASYNEIVDRMVKNSGAIHSGPPAVVFGLLLSLIAILLGPEAQSSFACALL